MSLSISCSMLTAVLYLILQHGGQIPRLISKDGKHFLNCKTEGKKNPQTTKKFFLPTIVELGDTQRTVCKKKSQNLY